MKLFTNKIFRKIAGSVGLLVMAGAANAATVSVSTPTGINLGETFTVDVTGSGFTLPNGDTNWIGGGSLLSWTAGALSFVGATFDAGWTSPSQSYLAGDSVDLEANAFFNGPTGPALPLATVTLKALTAGTVNLFLSASINPNATNNTGALWQSNAGLGSPTNTTTPTYQGTSFVVYAPAVVPLPPAILLFMSALGGLGFLGRFKRS